MSRGPPQKYENPGRIRPPPGQTHPQPFVKRLAQKIAPKEIVSVTVQKSPAICNPTIQFRGAVGNGPARPTAYGLARDIVDLSGGQRIWSDVVPIDPEVLQHLNPGDKVEVNGEVVSPGRRQIIRGTIQPLR